MAVVAGAVRAQTEVSDVGLRRGKISVGQLDREVNPMPWQDFCRGQLDRGKLTVCDGRAGCVQLKRSVRRATTVHVAELRAIERASLGGLQESRKGV